MNSCCLLCELNLNHEALLNNILRSWPESAKASWNSLLSLKTSNGRLLSLKVTETDHQKQFTSKQR